MAALGAGARCCELAAPGRPEPGDAEIPLAADKMAYQQADFAA